ncbi:MAG: Clp protease N-terminal domain-containing protein [Caldilineaceae bacterium]
MKTELTFDICYLYIDFPMYLYRNFRTMMRFDRFTEKAQEAMRAYEILQHYKHTQVDTEHMFLALMQQEDGTIPTILQQIEANTDIIVRKLETALERYAQSYQYALWQCAHGAGLYHPTAQAGDGCGVGRSEQIQR